MNNNEFHVEIYEKERMGKVWKGKAANDSEDKVQPQIFLHGILGHQTSIKVSSHGIPFAL